MFGDLVDGGHVTIFVNDAGEIELRSVPEPKRLEHKADESGETSKA